MPTLGGFRAWLRDEHYSERTRQQYLSYVTRAARDLGNLTRVTPETLRAWWATLPPTASSRNAARNALMVYYRYRGTKKPPLGEIPPIPEGAKIPRPVTLDDYACLFATAERLGGHHHLLYLFLALTGCRISEAAHARRRDLDLNACTWRIHGKGSNRRGPKERIVFLHPDLVTALHTWPEPDWIFPSTQRGGPVHRATAGMWWRELATECGVEATAHQIRHTVATIALDKTRDVRAVQELLGHASLEMVQRYTAVNGARVKEAVETLGPPPSAA